MWFKIWPINLLFVMSDSLNEQLHSAFKTVVSEVSEDEVRKKVLELSLAALMEDESPFKEIDNNTQNMINLAISKYKIAKTQAVAERELAEILSGEYNVPLPRILHKKKIYRDQWMSAFSYIFFPSLNI